MDNQFLQLNGRTKTGLDFVADLFSGRVHRTLYQMFRTLREVQQWRNEMTKNEQKILDAASVIGESAQNIGSAVEGLKATIVDLKNQLGQPTAEEDLSPEFDKLDSAVAGLKELSDNLNTHVAENPSPNNDTPSATPPSNDVSVSTPVTTQPGEPEAPGMTVAPQAVPADPAPADPNPPADGFKSPDEDPAPPTAPDAGTQPIAAETTPATPTGTPNSDTPDEDFD